ncbi:MAG TPA: hypothetical protein VI956_07645 [Nitrospirota bacterium]|nr:hypothetical protein [Nitrospirota bacterium]
MATAKTIRERDYLMEVFTELEAVKDKILALRKDLAAAYGGEEKTFMEHDRHLREMAEYIEWKLQVLEKGTPFDWKTAGRGVESDVSVSSTEKITGPDFSGGYLGG